MFRFLAASSARRLSRRAEEDPNLRSKILPELRRVIDRSPGLELRNGSLREPVRPTCLAWPITGRLSRGQKRPDVRSSDRSSLAESQNMFQFTVP